MIMTRTPLRVCLGGGGTDLPQYFTKHGGFLVSAALNQYIYIVIHKHFEKNIRLCYSKREIVQSSDEVRHPVVHEVMKVFGIREKGIEIISFSDIPSDTGVGSSSSFTVGLIQALATYQGVTMTRYETAEMACHIERERLKEAGGKQDQYIAAFGGITCLTFERDGKVIVSPLQISNRSVEKLEENILLFFTGIRRNSPHVQKKVIRQMNGKGEAVERLHDIKRLGIETEKVLRNGKIDQYGILLKEHWNLKKNLSNDITSKNIDRLYEIGVNAGAMAGKLVGAGGGGYLLFYAPEEPARRRLRQAMKQERLEELKYRFDFTGTSVLVDDSHEQKYLN